MRLTALCFIATLTPVVKTATLRHLPGTLQLLLRTGLLPVAFLAILLNMLRPEEAEEQNH